MNESSTYRLSKTDQDLLTHFIKHIKKSSQYLLGYPVAVDFDISELYPLLGYFLNNIGDPQVDPLHTIHSKSMEREVIDFLANLFRAPKHNYWGYITNGGTEGNLYALYLARELYPNAIVYYSEATHYSAKKNIHLLHMESALVHAQKNGEIDYKNLQETLKQYRHQPAIIFANIGTTMTEAKDNIATIKKLLKDLTIRDYFIHSDAALAGVYTALLKPHHPFDFADGADSITISGYKFIGSPLPCGVVIVKKSHKNQIGRAISYIGTLDTTISGSRSGHTPIFLWYALKRLGIKGLRKRIQECLTLAKYTHQQLQAIGWETWRNSQAITVMLAEPSKEIISKWQLATADGWSHIMCMPGVTSKQIDNLIKDLVKEKNEQKGKIM
ncbi:MAG TPA: histidine decarboxylase [Methylomirabilota bacterium]|nr:histidine decarboxylase [Methylomirabilota bacterium]